MTSLRRNDVVFVDSADSRIKNGGSRPLQSYGGRPMPVRSQTQMALHSSPNDDVACRCPRRRQSDDISVTSVFQGNDRMSSGSAERSNRLCVSKYLIRGACTSPSRLMSSATSCDRRPTIGTASARTNVDLVGLSTVTSFIRGCDATNYAPQLATRCCDQPLLARTTAVNGDSLKPEVVQGETGRTQPSGSDVNVPSDIVFAKKPSNAVIRSCVGMVVSQLDELLGELKTVAVDVRDLIGHIDHVSEQVGGELLNRSVSEVGRQVATVDRFSVDSSRDIGDITVHRTETATNETQTNSRRSASRDFGGETTTWATAMTSRRSRSDSEATTVCMANQTKSAIESRDCLMSGPIADDRNNNKNINDYNKNENKYTTTSAKDLKRRGETMTCQSNVGQSKIWNENWNRRKQNQRASGMTSLYSQRNLFTTRASFGDDWDIYCQSPRPFEDAKVNCRRNDQMTQRSSVAVMTSSSTRTNLRIYRQYLTATSTRRWGHIMTSSSRDDLALSSVVGMDSGSARTRSGDTPTTSGSDDSNYDGIYERDLDEILESGDGSTGKSRRSRRTALVGAVDRVWSRSSCRKPPSTNDGRSLSPDSSSGADCWSTDDDLPDDDVMEAAQNWNDWCRRGSPGGSARNAAWLNTDERSISPQSDGPLANNYSETLSADCSNPFAFHRLNRMFAVRRVRWRPEITIIEP